MDLLYQLRFLSKKGPKSVFVSMGPISRIFINDPILMGFSPFNSLWRQLSGVCQRICSIYYGFQVIRGRNLSFLWEGPISRIFINDLIFMGFLPLNSLWGGFSEVSQRIYSIYYGFWVKRGQNLYFCQWGQLVKILLMVWF